MTSETKSPSPSDTILAAARRTLVTEAEALARLADDLPADFPDAVRAMREAKGRVIVSGIGKSGHIGRKIAATLASTGTPAMFVHSTEASHGDLGMIGAGDVCLLISNSGETAELRDIIYHTRRFSIPMIGISSRAGSTLMQAADYRLLLPDLPEACPIGMAPTTSTTLTLALGDALAVALMEERGFMPEDFSVFHPGGKLGAQMRRVGEIMHRGDAVPTIDSRADMDDVLQVMTSKGFGIAALVEDGRLFGVITDGDLRRHMGGLDGAKAREIATRDPLSVTGDKLAAEALALIQQRSISALIVVDDEGRPVGVVHFLDFLREGVA